MIGIPILSEKTPFKTRNCLHMDTKSSGLYMSKKHFPKLAAFKSLRCFLFFDFGGGDRSKIVSYLK